MKRNLQFSRAVWRNDCGYVLLVLILAVTLMMIALAAVAPAIRTQIKRDREEEAIHRGTQYVRAIRRFYKKFGRYPTKLEDLEDTNHVRFLRRRYKDPLDANGKWRIIRFGQQKTALAGVPGPAGSAGLGQPNQTASNPNVSFSLSLPSSNSSSTANQQGANPGTPTAQLGTLQPGTATFGGGAIVGVAPSSDKESLKVFNKKSHYKDWEFVYDPQLDIANQIGVGGSGAAGSQPGKPIAQPGPPPGTTMPGPASTPGGVMPVPGPTLNPGPGVVPNPQQ